MKLTGAKLYGSASADTPANTVTGTYYLYDGENIEGRYRITTSKDRCGKEPIGENVTGYIDAAIVKPKGGKLIQWKVVGIIIHL